MRRITTAWQILSGDFRFPVNRELVSRFFYFFFIQNLCYIDYDSWVITRTLPTERTVKRMRLSKALTVPENITVYEACRRMATRKVDAVLLTDSNALLCGIFTDKVRLDHEM